MSNCKDCIHYEPCFEYGNVLDPIHGGVKCDSFKSTADVVPKSEVIEEYRKKVYSKMEKYTVFGREYIQRIMREAENEMVGEKDA